MHIIPQSAVPCRALIPLRPAPRVEIIRDPIGLDALFSTFRWRSRAEMDAEIEALRQASRRRLAQVMACYRIRRAQ